MIGLFFVPSSAWIMAVRGDFWCCESGDMSRSIHTHQRFFAKIAVLRGQIGHETAKRGKRTNILPIL